MTDHRTPVVVTPLIMISQCRKELTAAGSEHCRSPMRPFYSNFPAVTKQGVSIPIEKTGPIKDSIT